MKKLLVASALALTLTTGAVYADSIKDVKHSGFEETLSKLPADKADLVKTSMQDLRAKNKPRYEEMKALRSDIKEILVAPKFDKTAYLAKSKKLEQLQSAMHEDRTLVIANVAEKLTASERQIIADSFKKHRGFKHGKGEKPETK